MAGQTEEQLSAIDFIGAEVEEGPQKVSKPALVCGGFDVSRQRSQEQKTVGYLEGLKGLIAFEAFLWVFFRTVVPGAVF